MLRRIRIFSLVRLRPKCGFGALSRRFATPSGSARGTDRDIPASFPRSRSSRMALGGHELGEAVEGSRLEGGIKAVRVVDNPGLAGIMALDSTGGGGRQARVKPPVVCFRSDFHEPETAPVVYDLELILRAVRMLLRWVCQLDEGAVGSAQHLRPFWETDRHAAHRSAEEDCLR